MRRRIGPPVRLASFPTDWGYTRRERQMVAYALDRGIAALRRHWSGSVSSFNAAVKAKHLGAPA